VPTTTWSPGRRSSPARRAAQDDLAHRQRPARQRRRLGLQEYVLGLLFYRFISENLTAYLNGRARANVGDFDYARLSDEQAEFGRDDTSPRRATTSSPASSSSTCAPAPRRREPQRDPPAGLQEHRGLGRRHRQRGRPQGPLRRPRRQQLQARPHRGQAQREARQAPRRHRRPAPGHVQDNTIDLFGDAYEYLMQMYASQRRQVRGRVLHAPGGLRAAGPDHRASARPRSTRSTTRPPGRVAAAEVRQGARQGERAAGVLRPGDQPDHVQPGPHQHVPARHQLRAVRHRPRRHPAPTRRTGTTSRSRRSCPTRPTRSSGTATRTRCSSTTRGSPRPVCSRRSRRPTSPSRCTSCRGWPSTAPRRSSSSPGALPRRRGAKIRKYLIDNNYVDAVIQLPPDLFFGTTIATCIIVLKKSKADNAVLFIDASAEFTRVGNKNKLTEAIQQPHPRRGSPRARTLAHFAKLVPNGDIAANDYNIAVSSYVEAGGHPRGHRHHGAERRDRPDRRPAGRAAHVHRRHRRRPRRETNAGDADLGGLHGADPEGPERR
jgi:type I restriction enzyme M protein